MSVQHMLAEHFKEDVFRVLLQFGLALDDGNCACNDLFSDAVVLCKQLMWLDVQCQGAFV